MNTNEQEKLQIINAICEEAINIREDYVPATNITQKLSDTGVDSLDFITVFIYIGDIWGISDETFNKHPSISPDTPRPLLLEDIIMCINDVHTIDPTLEDALDEIWFKYTNKDDEDIHNSI